MTNKESTLLEEKKAALRALDTLKNEQRRQRRALGLTGSGEETEEHIRSGPEGPRKGENEC